MKNWRTRSIFAVAAVAACLAVPVHAAVVGAPLIARDNGFGTVDLPYIESEYVGPEDVHAWLNSGAQITAYLESKHGIFTDVIHEPGGIYDGEVERFLSDLRFDIIGVGPLEGWTGTVVIPTRVETHTGPRKLGAEVQSFDTNMMRVEGSAKSEDFEYIQVVGGTANGFESPGHTTLYRQDDGNWLVESTFNVKYQLKYKGAAGGKLDGVEGVTEGVITMTAVPAQTKR